jgi:hypothetical protein
MKKKIALNHPLLPAVGTLVLSVILGSMLLVFSTREAKADDGWGLVDCYCSEPFSSIGEPKKDHNELFVGNKLTWLLMGPTGTKVSIKFADQGACPGKNPFEDSTALEGTITNNGHHFDKITSSKIATGMGGAGKCYGYTVICTPPESTQSKTTDPIIDVPK